MTNLLEKTIAFFAPSWARKRTEERLKTKAFDSVYRAGSRTSRKMRKYTPYLSPQDISQGERDTIQARAQDAYDNQELAKAAVKRVRNSSVGVGLRVQSKPLIDFLGWSREQGEDTARLIEREFSFWSNSVECDVERESKFSEIQAIAQICSLVAGDVLVNTAFIRRNGSPYGTKVQLIDAARLRNKNYSPNSASLNNGVVLDSLGAPLAYHILQAHPSDNAQFAKRNTWATLRAFGVATGIQRAWLVHEKERAGQKRGVSFLAPILEKLVELDRYSEAEISAAVIAACQTLNVFVDDPNQAGTPSMGTETAAEQERNEVTIAPGAINTFNANDRIEAFNPGRPNINYDPFVLSIYKQIGAALGLPMEFMILHFQSSYSASRAAILQAWEQIKIHRKIMVDKFCQPIYEIFIDELVASGVLKIANYSDFRVRAAVTRASWEGPAMAALDPVKQANASRILIETGISTRQIESEKIGNGDIADITAQLGQERRGREAEGLRNISEKDSTRKVDENTENTEQKDSSQNSEQGDEDKKEEGE